MQRKTKETQVDVSIGLDGTGQCIAETPVPFLNHMLDVSLFCELNLVFRWSLHCCVCPRCGAGATAPSCVPMSTDSLRKT